MILLAFYFEYLNCFDEIFVELEFCDVLTNKLFAMDSRHLNTNCLNIKRNDSNNFHESEQITSDRGCLVRVIQTLLGSNKFIQFHKLYKDLTALKHHHNI